MVVLVFDVAKHLGEIQSSDGYIWSGVVIGMTGKELNHLAEAGTSAYLWLGSRENLAEIKSVKEIVMSNLCEPHMFVKM